ncbi:MAG: RHS repeat-associated core domain-containing protein [Acidimicrobiales bacterium]
MRARWYDTQSGVFTSVDPAISSTNQPYSYANGDPVNNSDPSGLWCVGFVVPIACGGGESPNAGPPTSQFVQYSLVGASYGHNQCFSPGQSACGYVYAPVYEYVNPMSGRQAASGHVVLTVVNMLRALYEESSNQTYSSDCFSSLASCLTNAMGIVSSDSGNPMGMFQLASDNSLVWYALHVQASTATYLVELSDWLGNFAEYVAPAFAAGTESYSTASSGCIAV